MRRLNLYKCNSDCNAELDYDVDGDYVRYDDVDDLVQELKTNNHKIREAFVNLGLFGIDENSDPTDVMIAWFGSAVTELKMLKKK